MAILHLHRREILLLQRSRVHVEDGRVVYSTAGNDGMDDKEILVRRWNIPTLNSSFLILGQGSSISQAAARHLHDDAVMLGFTGTSGTPFFMASQLYRPGERLQKWASLWFKISWRLEASKKIQRFRTEAVRRTWAAYSAEGYFNGDPSAAIADYLPRIEEARNVAQLMSSEGKFVHALYREAARACGIDWRRREPGEGPDRINRNLDHGNYLAYGIAAVALWAYGIPFSMPVTHGVTRNGGLVFDIADAFKDAVILPVCAVTASRINDTSLRGELIERIHGAGTLNVRNGTLGYCFDIIDSLFPENYDFSDIGLIEEEKLVTPQLFNQEVLDFKGNTVQ